MTKMSVSEAKAEFSRLIARVASGETVVITKSGKPQAMLAPLDRADLKGREVANSPEPQETKLPAPGE